VAHDRKFRFGVMALSAESGKEYRETARKAERFARSYAQTLAARVAEIRQVDLRYANGFAVQWRNTIQPNGG